jgi:glucose dehydrogenase
VQFVGADGRENEVTARQFVLAGGGVENPRILQLSASLNAGTDGLANSSGLLGRTFMSHSRIIVRGRLPEKFGPHRNGYATTNCWGLYQHDRLPEIGNIMLSPDPNNGLTPARIARRSRAWGHDLLEVVKAEYGQHLDLHVKGDMLPLPENRVRLSNRQRDRYGDPIPAVEMRLAEFDRRALDHGAEVAKQLLGEMSATQITASDYGIVRNHLMGTTRMGQSPDSSVCDEWGRCHDLDNLYIAGGSLFATAGCSSPTLTIAALALRTADYLDRAVL